MPNSSLRYDIEWVALTKLANALKIAKTTCLDSLFNMLHLATGAKLCQAQMPDELGSDWMTKYLTLPSYKFRKSDKPRIKRHCYIIILSHYV